MVTIMNQLNCIDSRVSNGSVERAAFLQGMRSVAPVLLGVAPFGLMAGVAAVSIGIDKLPAVAYSFIIFAGAAQLAMVDLLGRDVPAVIVVMTALIVNLRMVMYSAGLAPHFQDQPRGWKAVMAYLLTDQAFAVSIVRFQKPMSRGEKRMYYLGAALGMWCAWQICTALGVFLGARIPSGWSLDFAIPLTFMSLLSPVITDRASLAAAISAGSTAVLAAGLPHNLGLVAAAVVGIAAGLAVERGRE
jgi:predicted branched-subunit amino acid permease